MLLIGHLISHCIRVEDLLIGRCIPPAVHGNRDAWEDCGTPEDQQDQELQY